MDVKVKKQQRNVLFFSFLLPVIISTLCFALKQVAPFGTYSLLRVDAWGQYHPFLSLFRDTLLRGGSPEHTWSIGMGINFIPQIAYYLSSPFYLLSVLVPEAYLSHFMLLATIAKLGLAGLFFATFLCKVYRTQDKLIPFFALLYSLCAWSAGYYWNIIWLDVFALLPLLITGTVVMLQSGRFRLYILSLALCFWCNYYLSFCCCIFVLLSFIGYHICHWTGFKNLLRGLLRFALCSLVALSMTAVLILPTLLGMQNASASQTETFLLYGLALPQGFHGFSLSAMCQALAQVLSRNLTYSPPTYLEGLPNLFCGFSVLILAFSFLCNKKFSRRDRLFHGALLLLFLFSCIFLLPDFIWHGLHFPNMLPNRFTFLYSFTLLTMAFRGYKELHSLSFKRVLLAVAGGFIVIIAGFLYKKDVSFGYYAIVLNVCVLLATALALLAGCKMHLPKLSRSHRRCLCSLVFALLFLGESSLSAYSGFRKGSALDVCIDHATVGQELYETATASDPEKFYRAEFSYEGTSNDGSIHHYNGVDVFSSSALVNHANFASSLGLRAYPENNSVTYYESTPFSNTLCGIKYLMTQKDDCRAGESMPLLGQLEDYEIHAVPSYIGIGFMANSHLSDFASFASNKDPFAEQNELFRLATGLEGDLYQPIFDPQLEASEGCSLELTEKVNQFLYTVPDSQEAGSFTLRYTMDTPGFLAMSTRMVGGKNVQAYHNGELLFDCSVNTRGIQSIGYVDVGDIIEFTYTSDKYKKAGFSISLVMQNDSLLQQGLDLLSDEVWNITYADDTTLKGTITALEDGLFYSSIPYEPGWTVTVDGTEIPVATGYDPRNPDVKLTDALISFPLQAGTHEITMNYHTPGLVTGMVISLCSLAIFVLLILSKKETLLPNLILTKKENPNE